MVWIYGKPAQLTIYGSEGMASDGTARPGADIEFMVLYDPTAAGCNILHYCNPGADIVWSATGHSDTQHIGLQYGERCGQCDTMRYVAPQSGTMVVTASSLNDVSWTVRVSETDTSAGIAMIEDALCGDDPSYACGCEYGTLKIWFTVDKATIGNGMGYVDIIMDGNVVVPSFIVSLNSRGRMYKTIPCPSSSTSHIITVRAVGGNSASVTLPAGDEGACVDGTPVFTGRRMCASGTWQNEYTTNCGTNYKDSGESCVDTGDGYVPPSGDEGTDILAQITDFYENNKTVSILGIALLGGIVLFGGN